MTTHLPGPNSVKRQAFTRLYSPYISNGNTIFRVQVRPPLQSSKDMVTTTSTSTVSSEEYKKPPRKKPMITGIWPCKINGCNKQFAREADLKRHQRTTKMHSMPSFSCPQCDANFTRVYVYAVTSFPKTAILTQFGQTDALRRHQKSRHNGVVIEPVERNKGGDENIDGRSRSTTPSSKGKEKEPNNHLIVQTHQGAPTHTGPSSYYRSHTVTISRTSLPIHTAFQPSHLFATQTEAHIPQPSASSTVGPPWPEYPTTWQNGALPPNMGPMGYIQYYPSPHYRPHTNGYHTDPTTTAHQPQVPLPSSSSTSTSRHSSSIPPNFISRHTSASHSQSPPASISEHISDHTNLNLELEAQTGLTEADVVAAVQAVLMQAESEAVAKKQRLKELDERERLAGGGMQSRDMNINSDRGSVESTPVLLDLDDHGMLHGYTRPEPMEHILTEDGEPMLNPAELLTQESLASPPPS